MSTPQPPSTTVREAQPGDATRIAQVHIEAWRQSFRHMLSAQTLNGLDHAEHTQMWVDHIHNPNVAVHVGESDGVVVGFVLSGTADHDAPRDLELKMLYVLDQVKGTGLAQQLVDAAIGDRLAFLWVAVKNPRAQAFYAKNGFRPDGAEKVVHRWDDVVNIRVVR